MFQKAFSFVGTLLTGAAVLMMPGLSQAQHGGGHGGGGHGGGGHFGGGGGHFGGGGAHFAPGAGHFSGPHYGGYHSGVDRGHTHYYGSHYGHPYAHYGDRHYHPYSGLYGYPYYGFYGSSYPYYYDNYPYAWSNPTYDSGSYGTDGTTSAALPAGNYQALSSPLSDTARSDSSAHVTVKVPADAQLWFEGTATTTTGPVRQFNSPPLTPGSQYSYEVVARWNENGHDVTQTQQVEVTAGANVSVSFPVPPKTAG